VENGSHVFEPIREKLARELVNYVPEKVHAPLIADRWILASAFQKAVRRGEVETAQSAGFSLLGEDKQMFFRRLHVLAVEDLGVGDIELAICVLATTSEAKVRRDLGGDRVVVGYLIERLCETALDRTADHLLSIVQDHPMMEDERWELGRVPTGDLLNEIKNPDLSVADRSMATWYAAGTDKFRSDALWTRHGDPEGVFEAFGALGVEKALVEACRVATRKMRNPLPLFVPLIWLAIRNSQTDVIIETNLPTVRYVRGIPTYALGGHTRLGKRALRRFLKTSDPIRQFLERRLPETGWQDTADVAVFHAESALVRRQRLWDGFDELKILGIEGDVCRNGLEPESVSEFLEIVRDNMSVLDDIRVELLEDLQPEGAPDNKQSPE